MEPILISLSQVHKIAYDVLVHNGCDPTNATAVADTITAAEADLCHSHGLFRLPGYVAALKSGKVDGHAAPSLETLTPCVLRVDGHNCFAPRALQFGRLPLVQAAKKNGLAALALTKIHHFSSLWVEIEALTEQNLCAMAFTAYMPAVAPAGGIKPFYGTNPMAFGWPRKDAPPFVFDQASASMAKGDVAIAARDGKQVADGVGIDEKGQPTNDPNEILKGCLLPFGGYKGSSIALMIELLVGPLIGERYSQEAGLADNKDGGPPQGGELIIAFDPTKFGSSEDPFAHAERLFSALLEIEGTRLPGARRHKNRAQSKNQDIAVARVLYDKILELK